jgi:spore maturation protein CgeB
MIQKLLILDGISGITLGSEIADTFSDLQINTYYQSAKTLEKKKFNQLNGALYKIIHRHIYHHDYYKHPKITNRSLTQLIKQQQPTIIFVIGFLYRFFDLHFIKKLQQHYHFSLFLYDTDSCNLFNNKRELVYFFTQELPLYDHIYSCSKTTTELINKMPTLNASYFPFGANKIALNDDHSHITANEPSINHDILFVGSADMRRIFLLEQLVKFKLKVYGSKWQRNHSLISPQLNQFITPQTIWQAPLYREMAHSKIILNITRSTFYGVETGINLRIFETLAANRFLLTDHSCELSELFHIGEEIESYSSAEELKDKVQYYLNNDRQRLKVARRGHEKFLSHYTWPTRIKKLLLDLNQKIPLSIIH